MWRKAIAMTIVGVSLAAGGAAYANEWLCDFDNFTGSDGTAVASYTDIGGANPRTFYITTASTNWANLAAGWLTQGDIGASNKTAKFNNVADGKNGRARFTGLFPASMDANGGIVVTWRMRVGPTNPGRGPMQIAVTSDGAVHTSSGENNLTNSAFIRLRNNGGTGNSVVDILRNGGTSYSAATDPYKIDVLTLGSNFSNQWHQWTAAVIRDPVTGYGYWKLWLDGTQLLFTGSAGSPMFDPDGDGPEPSQQFSFATKLLEGFDGTVHNEPYVGLGDLNSQDAWDFEFDCVAYRDDSIGPFTCGGSTPPCDASVTPTGIQTVGVIKGQAAPDPLVFSFVNVGSVTTGYTVAETDAAGTATDWPWLSLDKTGASSVAPMNGSDPVTATITDTNMAAGTYSAYVTFRTTCSPVVTYTRRIDLVITDCAFTATPTAEVSRSASAGSAGLPADAVYTLTNTGTGDLTYHVEKVGTDHAWLTLSKSDGGPLGTGQSDTVTAAFNPAGVLPGVHSCQLKFSSTKSGCTNTPADVLCTVVLNVFSVDSASQEFTAEFTTFTGSDATALSALASCDPGVATSRDFHFQPPGQIDQLDPGWLTQGSIGGTPTTARFYNPAGAASGGLTGVGRARFRAFLPFDNTYDPVKGMAVAWRMRIGNYPAVRGPIQVTFPRVKGPYGTDESTSAVTGEVFNCFVQVQNGRYVNILNNGGGVVGGVGTCMLPASIAGSTDSDYHQWTLSACYQEADAMAYWNLWLDGVKLMFGGTNGSVAGPGGGIFSFRTGLDNVTGDPYIGLGELGSSTDIWDFDFDWVRLLSYNVSGCPFWDGEGCVPLVPCPTPFADADKDGDVDMDDFAGLQRCLNTGLASPPASIGEACRCFDHNHNKVIGDSVDFVDFLACATGKDVPWTPRPGCE